MDTTTPAGPPLLRVERGNPTPEELAALAAVVACLGAPEAEEQAPQSRQQLLRRQIRRGRHLAAAPGAWRSGRF